MSINGIYSNPLNTLALEAEAREQAKAGITPVGGAELGLTDNYEGQQRQNGENLRSDTDLVSLSAAARARTSVASSGNADPSGGEGRGPNLRSAGQTGAIRAGGTQAEPAEQGGSDTIQELRDKIREVQEQLQQAQEELVQATRKLEAAESDAAPEPSTGPGGGTAKGGTQEAAPPVGGLDGQAAGQGSGIGQVLTAEVVSAQSAAMAAEDKVNQLSTQLMELYQQLMDAQNASG